MQHCQLVLVLSGTTFTAFLTISLTAAATIPATVAHPTNSLELCSLPREHGNCSTMLYKWFWNGHACQVFMYGGCNGNANRFDSEIDCMVACGGPDYVPPAYWTTSEPPKLDPFFALKRPRPPVESTLPIIERGEELTFAETGHHKVFMMARPDAFIQMDDHRIPSFQLRLSREISFQFRTRLPHGLLVYHSVKSRPDKMQPYALYIIVEKGQLKVVHVYGKHSTSVTVGQGLNRDEWHSVTVRIDVQGSTLVATVDNSTEFTHIGGVGDHYGVWQDLPSVVLIGGLSPEEKLHGVKYIIESFVGCIKDVRLSAGETPDSFQPIKPLIASKHDHVQEGCINKCRTRENLCFVGSHCVNHYYEVSCDCYGTLFEGERCDVYAATKLTLRGSSFVSFRIYDWKDRVHSNQNRISLLFKTRFDDSALFYASGESHRHHHIAASIKNGSVVVEIDFWEGPPIVVELDTAVTNNRWHNLTIWHKENYLLVGLGDEQKERTLPGTSHYLLIDPEIYIGGGPELHKKRGLVSKNNFAGTLKYVFFNDISIIYELKKANPKVHYIGVLEPEFYEADVEVIPLTFPFPSSHIWWPTSNVHDELTLSFEFKSNRNMAVLAAANVTTPKGPGYWEYVRRKEYLCYCSKQSLLVMTTSRVPAPRCTAWCERPAYSQQKEVRVVNEEIRFELVPELGKNVTHLTTVKFDKGNWHKVELTYSNRAVNLTVDFRHKHAEQSFPQFKMGDRLIVGTGSKINTGLVGCMREIIVNGVPLEPRYVVRTRHTVGTVSLDNCQLVDPCTRPNACEHGGKCSVREDRVTCDCNNTGYIGKNCHFALYRKTCEELALLGYTKPDVYLIDIDGNGRFPPAHVKCEFQSEEDATKTIVEHNLPSQVDVRGASETDFSYSIKYREFSREMLQELISHSLYCSQYIKYDCYKAPLDLHSATWFVSAAGNGTVDYLGSVKRGACPCAENRTCVNPDMTCNCDISEAKWHSDEGYFSTPASLGITEMVFLQQKDLDEDSLGRITLGPLECVETNTQAYVVTFTTSQSYIEVPGWRKGDIAFSFRTTGETAILLYQPPIRPQLPSFMVALTSDFKLTFNFTLNTGYSRELEINSKRRLNSGEWQKIWIDYNEHHVRFMINTDFQMVDLRPEEEFGPFEGSMFIGGAPEDLLKKSSISQGLIGCFRGLVVNGEVLDIYSYMSVHLSEIIKDCKPSCDPSPCKNGAQCKELWSTFQCVCENPWAYIGQYCETNINVNGFTLVSKEAYLSKNFLFNETNAEKTLLKKVLTDNILLNLRTYDTNSLVLYANDHLNNFVHLYISNKKTIVFQTNSGNEIKRTSVQYPGLNSGKSVQIAIIRKGGEVILHVNEKNSSVPAPVKLLTEYSNKPWSNPEKEVLAPQRPPSPPTEYFQLKLGGYDPYNLVRVGADSPHLTGYVGCIRGFKIGDTVYDLQAQAPAKTTDTSAPSATPNHSGVIPGCRMKCDDAPCKHQGVCIEDFSKGESSCNCEHTSYYGEFCGQEKGADFGGESVLQRNFVLEGEVNQVKVQLAFSSSDDRKRNTALLLIQTESKRSYYLLVALSADGELIFEEDREGASDSIGTRIKDRNFLNGARHSLYYRRTNDSAILLVDREQVNLARVPVLSFSEGLDTNPGANEVHIGGLKTTDPRFGAYTSYSGCLSNVFLEVNHQAMKPVDEYMAFIKNGSEKVVVINPQGVRSAQCAVFDVIHKPRPGPELNSSLVLGAKDKAWVEDPPARKPYTAHYSDTSKEEEGVGKIIFIVLTSIFALVVMCVCWDVYRTNRNYHRRKEAEQEAELLWHKGPPMMYPEPPKSNKLEKPPPAVPRPTSKPVLVPLPVAVPAVPQTPQQNGGKQIRFQEDKELNWEPLIEEDSTLLDQSLEELCVSLQNILQEEEYGDTPSKQPLTVTFRDTAPLSSVSEDSSSQDLAASSKISSIQEEDDDDYDGIEDQRRPPIFSSKTRSKVIPAPPPVYMSEDVRTFANPISYLGGPRMLSWPQQRTSKESVLSLD